MDHDDDEEDEEDEDVCITEIHNDPYFICTRTEV